MKTTFSPRRLAIASALSMGTILGGMSAANAADVEVVISMPSVAILDYYSTVTVNVTAAALGALAADCGVATGISGDATDCNRGAIGPTNAAWNDPNLEVDFVDTPTGAATINAVPLILQDVWAIRGIHNNNIRVTTTTGAGATLSNGGASIVTSVTGSPVATDVAAPGLLPANAIQGDVTLGLDLTNATLPGNYANAGNPTYTLSVTLL